MFTRVRASSLIDVVGMFDGRRICMEGEKKDTQLLSGSLIPRLDYEALMISDFRRLMQKRSCTLSVINKNVSTTNTILDPTSSFCHLITNFPSGKKKKWRKIRLSLHVCSLNGIMPLADMFFFSLFLLLIVLALY